MKAAFFDVDGTLTRTRVWQGIMNYFLVHRQRRSTHLAFLVCHYPLYIVRRLGLITEAEFRAPWAAHLGWYFRGYSLSDGQMIWDWVVTEFIHQYWRQDIGQMVQSHLDEGDLVVLVSGGPEPLLKRIAEELGVAHIVGTPFEVRDGHYTGRVAGEVCLDEYKPARAQAYLAQHVLKVDFNLSYAYADSISDLPLLEMVGFPVAVYPFDELRAVALERGWSIYPTTANTP